MNQISFLNKADNSQAAWVEAVQNGMTLLGFADWQKAQQTGVSFLMHCPRGEDFLVENLNSLVGLKTPYEIIAMIDTCDDASEQILLAYKNQEMPIHIHYYPHRVSTLGFQSLVTDCDSVHSPAMLWKFGLGFCRLAWVFRWDADFVCSKGLFAFLNSIGSLAASRLTEKASYKIAAQFDPKEKPEEKDHDLFMSNAITGFAKSFGGIRPAFSEDAKVRKVVGAGIVMKNTDRENDPRRGRPWFLGTGGVEEERYRKLAALFGKGTGDDWTQLGQFDNRFSWDKLSGSEEELEKMGIHCHH